MTKKIHVYSSQDCPYCTELKQMLDNYPITYEVTDVDKNEEEWDEMCKTLNIEFVPTVIIVEDGAEVARIEGYPGEDFFWQLLNQALLKHSKYKETEK